MKFGVINFMWTLPSQTFSNKIHKPLLHLNSGHSVQFSISSLLSLQSALPTANHNMFSHTQLTRNYSTKLKLPSHKKLLGMHCFECLHWNRSGGHVTAAHRSGCSSVPSLHCAIPSQTICFLKQRFPSHTKPLSPEDEIYIFRIVSKKWFIFISWSITNRIWYLTAKSAIIFGIAWTIISKRFVVCIRFFSPGTFE